MNRLDYGNWALPYLSVLWRILTNVGFISKRVHRELQKSCQRMDMGCVSKTQGRGNSPDIQIIHASPLITPEYLIGARPITRSGRGTCRCWRAGRSMSWLRMKKTFQICKVLLPLLYFPRNVLPHPPSSEIGSQIDAFHFLKYVGNQEWERLSS